MDYCPGGELFDYLKKRNFTLQEKQAANFTHQILTGVFYAHQYGIAHRDLKPENILLSDNSDDPVLKIIDFGLGKIIGTNETCNEPYGTLVSKFTLH